MTKTVGLPMSRAALVRVGAALSGLAIVGLTLSSCDIDTGNLAAFAGGAAAGNRELAHLSADRGTPAAYAPGPAAYAPGPAAHAPGPTAMIQVTPTLDPGIPVPRYDVIAQRNYDRPDRTTSYYVSIDPVDPTTDGFKAAVKQILRVLASVNGGPVFSAHIWDHPPAAQTEVGYVSNPDLFSDEMYTAKEVASDRHLVASYVGGLASANQPPTFVVFWFPKAGYYNQEVGSWVGAEVWRP